MRWSRFFGVAIAGILALGLSLPVWADYHMAEQPCSAVNPCAAANPCAAVNPCNPCAARNPCAANPCAANPCAAKVVNPCNPCAAKAMMAKPAVARMVVARVVSIDPAAQTLTIRSNGGSLALGVDRRTAIKSVRAMNVKKSLADLKPGDKVTVSYLERGGKRTAAYVYIVASAAVNPCNPCAARNPCAANPCAANPCAANPCAAQNPCAANPCAAR